MESNQYSFLVMKTIVWKDKYKLLYVSPSQIVIKSIETPGKEFLLQSSSNKEIEDVKIMGQDNFIVARTKTTLIIGDILQGLLSEV